MSYCVIFVTCASKKEAAAITAALLEERLVACGSILGPVESRYRWKGKVERSREVLLILKTRRRNFAAVAKTVKRLHRYQVPEIIALPVAAGSREYLRWIADNA